MDNQLLFAIGTSLVTVGISWGIMQATGSSNRSDNSKLWNELEDVRDDIDSIKEKYVTMEHFKAVIRPLQSQISEIGRDVKQILGRVHRDDRT